ncbi:phosphotransferase [Stenotrophomonas sp. JAI102]|uniref:phosphotransferase enzyme family protein n=1 Tax=Stenotrophomonas sp. JAI102 TaxID=2723077 RepID=UPI0015CA5BDC|nr:phosphotransferase [Stenotrophomonas sp. JAI102]NYF34854.1 Ser/Thr protein kinase RdoA (MazF antagonist) [Stenotrophomonas sp. JAI102]
MSNSTHRVQGLNNDEVAADWPAITDREIAWLRGRFAQLDGECQLLWHSPRPLSAAAIVESRGGRVFVKRHHGSVRTTEGLAEEHRFLQHLAGHGVPVVEVLRDRDGATAVEHEGWTYELHSVGRGHDLYRDAPSWTLLTDAAQAREAGRMLATLHRASASYRAPQRSTHLLVARDDLIRAADPVAALQDGLGDRPGLAAYLARQDWQADLQRSVLPWHAGLAVRLQAEPRLWAHNDWHVSNLLWRPHGDTSVVATVLDVGLASPTSALFDLATAIERNAIAWLALEHGEEAVRVDIALALLAGYREIVPLSAERVHLLADLLPVVQLDFALSEVEYFEGVTHSPANADVAYHTFLLGHADWFSTAAGQGLLKALHAAA